MMATVRLGPEILFALEMKGMASAVNSCVSPWVCSAR